jgi:type II secretory pathway pseudopilin PulG
MVVVHPRFFPYCGNARSSGFTYLGLLFAIAVLGLTLSTVGVVWSTQIRRDKEEQLLFVGDQIRDAIGRYRAAGGQYPEALTDLLTDSRTPAVRRFLRKIYVDPITNSADWQLIMAPEGGIMGVASRSLAKPIKVAAFPALDTSFEKAECYCDWQFVYSPRSFRHRHVIRQPSQS